MVCLGCFQTQNPNLGKFWKVLQRKMLVFFMTKWYMLWLFGICIFPRFGMLYREKSGNPGHDLCMYARDLSGRHRAQRFSVVGAGLPDLSWYNMPKWWGRIYQMTIKFVNGHKPKDRKNVFQMKSIF
jgi:hypothetical protein